MDICIYRKTSLEMDEKHTLISEKIFPLKKVGRIRKKQLDLAAAHFFKEE